MHIDNTKFHETKVKINSWKLEYETVGFRTIVSELRWRCNKGPVVVNRRQTCSVFKACAWPTGCINRAPSCTSTPTLTAALHAGMMIPDPSYPSLTSPASLPWSMTEFQPASTMDHGHTCGCPERFLKKTVSNQKKHHGVPSLGTGVF